jgi:hypothetical protein
MLSNLKTLNLFASSKEGPWLWAHSYLKYEDGTGKCLLRQAPLSNKHLIWEISENSVIRNLAMLSTTGINPATLSALSQSAIWTQTSRLPSDSAAETSPRPSPKLTRHFGERCCTPAVTKLGLPYDCLAKFADLQSTLTRRGIGRSDICTRICLVREGPFALRQASSCHHNDRSQSTS